MKKIIYFYISLIIFVYINACTGYKPIYTSQNLNFEIIDYSISGDKKLAKQIYSKLYNLSKTNKNSSNSDKLNISIDVKKDKSSTAKSSTGKILEYKIKLITKVEIDDVNNNTILNHNFTSFSSYKVQDQYSETLKLENRSIENLLEKTFQDLVVQMSGIMLN